MTELYYELYNENIVVNIEAFIFKSYALNHRKSPKNKHNRKLIIDDARRRY